MIKCHDFRFLFVAVLNVCQGGRPEARPLIAVFGVPTASKQNGKLIDSCWGGRREGRGRCVHA